ncbi:MAG TPA: hypothetical protein VJR89_22375, partial [Polyangiales bacterium]|nr:hypothetical protein [Polyangiales bacterium]
VALDARSSFDPAGAALRYSWTQTGGPAVMLSGADSALPSFSAPLVSTRTVLSFAVQVTSAAGTSSASIELPIAPPSAAADISALGRPLISEPAPIGGGSYELEVIRDGVEPPAGSSDPLLRFDTFAADPGVLEGFVGYEFATPHRFSKLRFQEGGDFPDGGWFGTLRVEVRQRGRWLAVAGLRSTPAYPGIGDGVGFQVYELDFTPTLGDGVRIFGAPGGTARFFSVAELRAFAVGAQPNAAPLADAGDDAVVPCRVQVSLDGTRSLDPDGDALTYTWRQTAGTRVQLSDASAAMPTFTVPLVAVTTTLTFSLTVSDGVRSSAADTVSFTVDPARDHADLTASGAPICSVRRPFGGGNPSLEVIRDGVRPAADAVDPLLQYDTYTGLITNQGWVGYQLPQLQVLSQLVFQEGLHFVDGGWFERLEVQVRRGGEWRNVSNLTVTPAYPGADDGQSWQTYTLSFTPELGEAIRLIGPPAGFWTFFSVAELRVYGP